MGTNAGVPDAAAHTGGRALWLSLLWKLGLVAALFLVLSFDNPVLVALNWGFINLLPTLLLLWGAFVVGAVVHNLCVAPRPLRKAWVALGVGAYAALAIPGAFGGTARWADALGPVVALTLAAHLGRRDLPGALRDWTTITIVSLLLSLGLLGMLAVAATFGTWAFLVAILFPPLVFEATILLLGRGLAAKTGRFAQIAALLLATALAVVVLSFTLLEQSTPLFWTVLFDVVLGILIGGTLLIAWKTKPMIEVASGARRGVSGLNMARILVELSQAPVLLSLALYLPLRLLNRT